MCGVPYHAVEGYLTRLLRMGYRIAICDQMEDPKLTKKIVRREVTRVLTPGTALDAALGQEQNNFLAALFETGHESKQGAKGRSADTVCAVALLDVSTGEFRTAEFQGAHRPPAGRGRDSDGQPQRGAAGHKRRSCPLCWSAFRPAPALKTGSGPATLPFPWSSAN